MGLGDFIWFEVVTHDADTVELFYRNIIGWTPRTQSAAGGTPYTLFLAGETPVAGISAASPPEESRSHWFGYVHVEDLDDKVDQVESLGGEIHGGPMEVPGFGEFYVVSDTSDVVFALFEPEAPSDFDALDRASAGHFDWKELYAEDLDRALDFYVELFDWETGEVHDMKSGRYQIVRNNDEPIGGITGLKEMEGEDLPLPHWNFYVKVADIDASANAIQSNAGTILSGPMEVPGGDRVLTFRDPTGAVASLTGG